MPTDDTPLKAGDQVEVTRTVDRTHAKEVVGGEFIKMDGNLAVIKLDFDGGGLIIWSQLYFVRRMPSPEEIDRMRLALHAPGTKREKLERERESTYEIPRVSMPTETRGGRVEGK